MEAIDVLRHHCIGRFDIDDKNAADSFLDKLRPFSEVSESDFLEIINASDEIYRYTDNSEVILKDAIYQLNGCAHYLYLWGLREGAMLKSNKLINEEQENILKKMFTVLMETISQLSNPHDRTDNGMSPKEIYSNAFQENSA